MDLTHTIYYPQEYVGECEHGYPLPFSFAFGIDLTENDICGRITFPFITAVDKTNATSNRIDHAGRGEKKRGEAPLKSTTHPRLCRCNVIDDYMDKLNNKNETNARNR